MKQPMGPPVSSAGVRGGAEAFSPSAEQNVTKRPAGAVDRRTAAASEATRVSTAPRGTFYLGSAVVLGRQDRTMTARVWICMFAIGCLLFDGALRAADPSRGEMHPIHTTTLTDEQFLAGVKEGTPTTLAGELRFPAGSTSRDRVGVIVLVHGSGGIGPGLYQWAREFNDLGLATFMLDGFTGRGVTSTREEQGQLGMLSMLVDAYRVLDLLAKHPRIDAKRIGILGGSRGAQPALFTALRRFHRLHGPADAEFAAHFVFYPNCVTTFIDEVDTLDHPIRIFHGGADEAAATCAPYAERLKKAGNDVEFMEFPGVHHACAEPVGRVLIAQAQGRKNCRLEERAGGALINLVTGQPFTWKDACVSRSDVTFESNAAARAQTVAAIRAVLVRTFQVK